MQAICASNIIRNESRLKNVDKAAALTARRAYRSLVIAGCVQLGEPVCCGELSESKETTDPLLQTILDLIVHTYYAPSDNLMGEYEPATKIANINLGRVPELLNTPTGQITLIRSRDIKLSANHVTLHELGHHLHISDKHLGGSIKGDAVEVFCELFAVHLNSIGRSNEDIELILALARAYFTSHDLLDLEKYATRLSTTEAKALKNAYPDDELDYNDFF